MVRSESEKASAGKMKFGKRLQNQIEETMPEWREHFISYKKLKKSLKNMQAEAAFAQGASFSLVGVDRNATSIVEAVDIELRRAYEAGGPASVQQALRSKLSENGVRFVVNGSAAGRQASPVDGPLLPAVSSVEHIFKDSALPGNVVQEKRSEDFTEERRPKRAKLEDGNVSSKEDFVSLLNKELNKLNDFFTEKEEEYVIHLQVLFACDIFPSMLFLVFFALFNRMDCFIYCNRCSCLVLRDVCV